MGKVLIFTDVHVAAHKRKIERLQDCLNVIEWVFKTAKENNIESILFGGDLFHDRQKIDIYTYQKLFEVFRNNLDGKVKLYLLLGNHDLWFNDNTSISSVIPLSALPGVVIIDKPTRLNIAEGTWDFIPFTHDPISALDELKNKEGVPQYCLGHIAIDGAILHGDHVSDVVIEHDGDMVKVSESLFTHYDNVILGHYHCLQKIGKNIEYLGSPLQLSFGEAGQKKNILIFDCKTGDKNYVENKFSPVHLVLREKDLDKHNLKNNFVQVIVEEIGASDLVKMRKEIGEKDTLGSLEIKQKNKKMNEHIITDAKSILFKEEEMLAKYVDEIGTDNLDKDLLIEIGKDICQKTIAV